MSVLKVLTLLDKGMLKVQQIAAVTRLSTDEVNDIETCAIDLANGWLQKRRKPSEKVAVIASANGAVSAMSIHLKSATKTKYAKLRAGFSTAMQVTSEFIQSWMDLRDGTYLSADSPGAIIPLLELLKVAEVSPEEISFRFQSLDQNSGDALEAKALVCKDFQYVWNLTPEIFPVDYVHGARANAYLIYPGVGSDIEVNGPAYASVRGLDALFFAAAVYSRVMEKNCAPA
jgi:hypothetical protein